MIEIIKKIIYNVLATIYESFGLALVLAVLFMFFYMCGREHGWKVIIQRWIKQFRQEKRFRRVFFLALYTAMILFRTLLNRSLWPTPLQNVIGVWGLYDAEGVLTTETIENLVLFIPFTFLLLCVFKEKVLKDGVKLLDVFVKLVAIVFLFSLSIEFLQLFLRLGTFQLSDLFYNTLGGFLGGLVYWIIYKINAWKKRRDI